MNPEFLSMRNCLERITGGAVFSEDYSGAEDAVKGVFIGSLYTQWMSLDMQDIMRKHVKSYVFRESLLNKRDVMFIIADENGRRFYNLFPSWLCCCEIDFIEREKLEEYRKLVADSY